MVERPASQRGASEGASWTRDWSWPMEPSSRARARQCGCCAQCEWTLELERQLQLQFEFEFDFELHLELSRVRAQFNKRLNGRAASLSSWSGSDKDSLRSTRTRVESSGRPGGQVAGGVGEPNGPRAAGWKSGDIPSWSGRSFSGTAELRPVIIGSFGDHLRLELDYRLDGAD